MFARILYLPLANIQHIEHGAWTSLEGSSQIEAHALWSGPSWTESGLHGWDQGACETLGSICWRFCRVLSRVPALFF